MQEIRTPGMQSVVLSTKSLSDYAPVVGEDVIAELERLARPLQGARVLHINATAYGGGVAELREPRAAPHPLDRAAQRWLGEPTGDIIEAVRAKQELTALRPATWPAGQVAWDEVRRAIAGAMAPFPEVERALEQAQIPAAPGFLGLTRETLEATLHHATRLRDRYTTIDFLEGQGRLDQAITEALV